MSSPREVIFLSYTIGEFARITGLGIHTLRYYEHEGLLAPQRTAANRRRYSDQDIAWIDFIKRLKATAMPIRKIKRYAALRAAGAPTLRTRMEMLTEHRRRLREQIVQLQEHEAKLNEKIAFYQREIAGKCGDA